MYVNSSPVKTNYYNLVKVYSQRISALILSESESIFIEYY